MISSDNKKDKDGFSLTYSFTSKEIAVLAKYLRENQTKLPEGLEHFYKAMEDSVYNSLSLEEVRNFYS
ncbi:MAG: hypothetical protein J5527_06870 [Treponema sp.]|jgi:hypothetical protein|nr:hypothetical protein [Treponema sp.]